MWTPGGKSIHVTEDGCEICGRAVGAEEKAMQCDLCDT